MRRYQGGGTLQLMSFLKVSQKQVGVGQRILKAQDVRYTNRYLKLIGPSKNSTIDG